MTPKQYLMQAFKLDDEINRLIDERGAIYSTLLGSQELKHDKVKGSPKNAVEDTYVRLAEYSKKIDEKIDQLVNLKLEISELIDKVPEQNLKTLLTKRYVELKRFEEIAVEMNYDIRWVYRLHGRALQVIDEENPGRFKTRH